MDNKILPGSPHDDAWNPSWWFPSPRSAFTPTAMSVMLAGCCPPSGSVLSPSPRPLDDAQRRAAPSTGNPETAVCSAGLAAAMLAGRLLMAVPLPVGDQMVGVRHRPPHRQQRQGHAGQACPLGVQGPVAIDRSALRPGASAMAVVSVATAPRAMQPCSR